MKYYIRPLIKNISKSEKLLMGTQEIRFRFRELFFTLRLGERKNDKNSKNSKSKSGLFKNFR